MIFTLINIAMLFLFYHVINRNYVNINEIRKNMYLLGQQIESRSFDISNDSYVLKEIEKFEEKNYLSKQQLLPIVNNQHIHMFTEAFLSHHNLSTITLNITEVGDLKEVGTIVDLTANISGDISDFYNFLLDIENQNTLIIIEMIDVSRDTLGNYNLSFTLRFLMTQYGSDSNFKFNFEYQQYLNYYQEQYI